MNKMSAKDLLDILGEVKRSHAWMLEDMIRRADILNEGNHSDELKHAKAVQELLELLV